MRRFRLRGKWERNWIAVWLLGWGICVGTRSLFNQFFIMGLTCYFFVGPLLISFVLDKELAELARSQFENLNSRPDARVEYWGNKLLAGAALSPEAVSFQVGEINMEGINGYFAWPNHVVVTQDCIDEVSEAELLGVLAHELGHYQIMHATGHMQFKVAVAVFAYRLEAVGSWGGESTTIAKVFEKSRRYVMGVVSRYTEHEADKRGFDILVRSGQPLEGPALLLHRMMQYREEEAVEEQLLSTHPDRKDRFAKAVDRLEAVAEYQIRVRGTELYVRDKLFARFTIGNKYYSERAAISAAGRLIKASANKDIEIRQRVKVPLEITHKNKGGIAFLLERLLLKSKENSLPNLGYFAGY